MATAGRINVSPLPQFDPVSDPSSLGQRWTQWKRRFEIYILAVNVTNDAQKRALLLYQAGAETQQLYDTLPVAEGEAQDYATTIAKLDAYFLPQKNVDFEIFQFRQAKQHVDETTDQYVTRLRKLAAHCEFADLEKELKATIIQNCVSKSLRRFALREEKLTLENLLSKARALEASEAQAKDIEVSLEKSEAKSVQFVRKNTSHKCYRCGFPWPHKNKPCPATEETCRQCGKTGHFARVCKSSTQSKSHTVSQTRQNKRLVPKRTPLSRSIRQVQEQEESHHETDSSEDEYLFICMNKADGKMPKVKVKINDIPLTMIVDTGASLDIIDEVTFHQLQQKTDIQLGRASTKLFAYGSDEQLPLLGQFTTVVETSRKLTPACLHVVKGNFGSLMSYKTASALDLVRVEINTVQKNDNVLVTVDDLEQKYPSLFRGIGKLKNFEVKLHIDKNVQPVAQAARRIPFHLCKRVAATLQDLESQGIIEPVSVGTSTPWVSPVVIIPKNDDTVRLCVDMRMPNRAIKRERYPSPTVDDLIHSLNGATVFSKFDLRSGYHQLVLSEESRSITTFVTHKGIMRYKRLNFGTSSACEIFQHAISKQIADIDGVLNISDDLVIFGKTQADHDRALHNVCKRFQEVGLTLNKDKCKMNEHKITFFGYTFSAQGISADPRKVTAIHTAPPPESVKEIRSFLGMATYCAKFIPHFSDLSAPLRALIRKNSHFSWTHKEQQAFDSIKQALTSETVIAYFDKNKETELVTDASPTGLSAILSQKTPNKDDRKIISYVSRTLSDVERRYSQTEKEALAIVWAIERLHIYLYGAKFTLFTDCKPIQMILCNPKSRPPARIERWYLRLQPYDFDVIYKNGNDNPSDYMSRHIGNDTKKRNADKTSAEEYVNFLAHHVIPKAMTMQEIQDATLADRTLQMLIDIIEKNSWNKLNAISTTSKGVNTDELKLFAKIHNELTVNASKNIVLRGSRLIVPQTLRARAISIAHEGHQGLVKTKQLIREKIWFPGIDKDVKHMIDNCVPCQAVTTANKPAPLRMNELPPAPWHTLHLDHCGPFPTGEYILVVIDAYTRYPEIAIVKSTSAFTTINHLNRIFATHGLPSRVKTDNGPPFNSKEFKDYMSESGIFFTPVTPLWPQANAEAENFNKVLEKTIRTAQIEGKDWKRELYRFLLNYRATPHTTTKHSPAKLLFNREIRTKLPSRVDGNRCPIDAEIRENDKKEKRKMKENADTKSGAKERDIQIGDLVLIRQKRRNKFSSNFDPKPYRVVKVKGTTITALRNGHYVTRNISFYKRIPRNDSSGDNSGDVGESIEDDLNEDSFVDQPQNVQENELQVRYPRRNRQRTLRFGQNIYDC